MMLAFAAVCEDGLSDTRRSRESVNSSLPEEAGSRICQFIEPVGLNS
jgi:hypothetical protein